MPRETKSLAATGLAVYDALRGTRREPAAPGGEPPGGVPACAESAEMADRSAGAANLGLVAGLLPPTESSFEL